MEEKSSTSKVMGTIMIVLGVGIILLIVFSSLTYRGPNGVSRGIINPPRFRITGKDLDTTVEGTDYVAYVHITVRNEGGDGSATVYVRVYQGSDSWTQSRYTYLNSGRSTDFYFKFSEVEFWTTGKLSYTAWIE